VQRYKSVLLHDSFVWEDCLQFFLFYVNFNNTNDTNMPNCICRLVVVCDVIVAAIGGRFTTTLACMMDLHFYPMDVQNCTVEIESCKIITFSGQNVIKNIDESTTIALILRHFIPLVTDSDKQKKVL